MSTTPSPPVECNHGTESVLSVSDLSPVTPRRPRRGRPKKVAREGQSGTQAEDSRRLGQDSQPRPQFSPPSIQSRGSSSSHNSMGGSMYGGEERPNGVQFLHGRPFEPELHHDLFPIVSPLRHSDTSITNFNGYFTLPATFGSMIQGDMGPMHSNDRGGVSGMHPVLLDAFELGSQHSPASMDQRSASPSSQWSSDALSGMTSITPEERQFPPAPYFFDTMSLADPHWPTHSADSQGTFGPGIGIEEPGTVGHPGLVIGDFSCSQPFPGATLNSTMGPLHGNSHQSSQSQNSQSMQHEMQRHIPYADCNCPGCQHFHTSGWESR